MQPDFVSFMRKMAPDLIEEITRRAMILDRIAALQPVGRRQLSQVLGLPEREIRNTAAFLKELGYIELGSSGMTVTDHVEEILELARDFSKTMSGITDLETRLCSLLPVQRVLVVPGNAEEDPQVLSDVGRVCAQRLKEMLCSGDTLAVTGGTTLAEVARQLQPSLPMNVMVVPARGGLGRSVELQANTLAAEIAAKLGGHHRLIHLPDHLDATSMQELLKLPEVSEAVELLMRAHVVLHGVSPAERAMKERQLSRREQLQLQSQGAKGESLGNFYDMGGKCLLESSGMGADPGRLTHDCRFIAVAAGASKAEAIIAVLRSTPHALLLTDEAAAKRMLQILDKV